MLPGPTKSFFAPLTLMIFATLPLAEGEIRCYCNLPSCVNTGYMCKSSHNLCFSDVENSGYSNDLSRSRHGCLELLNDQKKALCQVKARSLKLSPGASFKVFCCEKDMCNYGSSMGINIQVHTRPNHSLTEGIYDYDEEFLLKTNNIREGSLEGGLWFRAAVIAVPIAGSFILIMLILLAVRMLRKDSKRQQRLLELRQQRQFKTRLLLGNFGCRENRKKCNEHNTGGGSGRGLYKNVNIVFSRDSWITDISDKTNNIYGPVSWPSWKPFKPSPITLV
ncbi:BMP and activin membrane-bound inhibitor homolog [Limulus polyphemus]|uniref:BMP and activin membrane-bound inhibitor homolog n=1 Tax=Limulus polyphemus TaxID=6850 RepID=A0ABM1BX84_LIMPO|nr:BMP and activin membrane-bound inhibitor homolog [Limulus polyphemus]